MRACAQRKQCLPRTASGGLLVCLLCHRSSVVFSGALFEGGGSVLPCMAESYGSDGNTMIISIHRYYRTRMGHALITAVCHLPAAYGTNFCWSFKKTRSCWSSNPVLVQHCCEDHAPSIWSMAASGLASSWAIGAATTTQHHLQTSILRSVINSHLSLKSWPKETCSCSSSGLRMA